MSSLFRVPAGLCACVGLVGLLTLPRSANAQSTAIVEKQYLATQTDAATVVAGTGNGGAWRFSASAPLGSTGTKSITPPGSSALVLPLDTSVSPNVYEVHGYFTSLAALNAAYPNGTYDLTFDGDTFMLALTNDAYPSVPLATASTGVWHNATLFVAAGTPVTLTFPFGANYVSGRAHMSLAVTGGSYSNSADTGTDLTQSQWSITIPADTLQGGVTYTVKMDSDNLVSLDTTTISGVLVASVYESETQFPLQVGTLPAITTQPVGQTVLAGQTVTLTAAASGSPTPTYQWQLNGANLANATGSTLVLANIGTTQAGSYTVVVSNPVGSVTSNPANVTVNVNAHLINLSSRSYVGTGAQVLVAGFVVAGNGTKQVLVRGDGPALTTFNVTGVLAHPLLSLFDNTSAVIATNTGWSTTPVNGASAVAAIIAEATTNAFNQVYAFTLPVGSADSAMLAGLPSAAYTAEINGVGNTTGVALAELYDADTGTPTAHLINLSARAFVNTGSGVLVAGFVISGSSSETVLIRGIGPALGLPPFNLPGVLAAPQLALYDSTGAVIAANTGWSTASLVGASSVPAGVQAATTAIMNSLYAFSLAANSPDCAMIVTLPPGAYTAQVSGVGSTTGVGLVEVYDVP